MNKGSTADTVQVLQRSWYEYSRYRKYGWYCTCTSERTGMNTVNKRKYVWYCTNTPKGLVWVQSIQKVRLILYKQFKTNWYKYSSRKFGWYCTNRNRLCGWYCTSTSKRLIILQWIPEVRLILYKYFQKRADGATYKIQEVRLMICKYFRKRADGATYRIQEVRLMIRKYFKKESWWLNIPDTGSTADAMQVLQKRELMAQYSWWLNIADDGTQYQLNDSSGQWVHLAYLWLRCLVTWSRKSGRKGIHYHKSRKLQGSLGEVWSGGPLGEVWLEICGGGKEGRGKCHLVAQYWYMQ